MQAVEYKLIEDPQARAFCECGTQVRLPAVSGYADLLKLHKSAQAGNFRTKGMKRNFPGYSQALSEIRKGSKQSHWIWYIWPSLAVIRPKVRFPEFLLPNFEASVAYYEDRLLLNRLLEISRSASTHLKNGIAPEVLFGKQHKYDAAKFQETTTLFALIAFLKENLELSNEFGESSFRVAGSLHLPTVELVTEYLCTLIK